MDTEERIFREALGEQGMRITAPRLNILHAFLRTEQHVSADDLYRAACETEPGTGFATVHRTLKLLCECGLAREVDLGDRITRFEHNYDHEHHDHLVCTVCGRTIEFNCAAIEYEQEKIARKYGFTPTTHKMQIYGYCDRCRGAAEKDGNQA